MKPTEGMTPTASKKLDNYITMNFEDVNGMTEAEQHSQELENSGVIIDESLADLTDQEGEKVCVKYDESDEWMGE